jgi:hypothetical protein
VRRSGDISNAGAAKVDLDSRIHGGASVDELSCLVHGKASGKVYEDRVDKRGRRLGPLDGEHRPGAVAIAGMQVRAPQARSNAGHHDRSGDGAASTRAHVHVRAVQDAAIEQLRDVRVVCVGEDHERGSGRACATGWVLAKPRRGQKRSHTVGYLPVSHD